jgi:hypothetical protein
MIWKYDIKNNSLVMIYGFKNINEKCYDAILTIEVMKTINCSTVYGFLSRKTLTLKDFRSLSNLLKEILPTEYLRIEVIPEQMGAYKVFFKDLVVGSIKSKTFNGHDSEILLIKMR